MQTIQQRLNHQQELTRRWANGEQVEFPKIEEITKDHGKEKEKIMRLPQSGK